MLSGRRLHGHVPGDEGAAEGEVQRLGGTGPCAETGRRQRYPARGDGLLHCVYALPAAARRRGSRLVSRRLFPVLLLLFAASGCAALIYEVVWLQLLQLVVGSTAVSMAVLLSAYMGGLCAGSYLLPRLVSPRQNPFRIYAFIELGIGVLGVA